MKFDDLKLHPFLLKAVKDEGYINPTKIQEKAIPHILNKKDILGSAQTGTGKTAAFVLHLMIVDKNEPSFKRINVLVVTPTRELAIQIGENFTTYSKYTDINNTVIFGGVKQIKQTDKLKKGIDILIATPGRLLDLMSQGYISLKDISYFVLDEADRMLDMGFINDIKKIIDKLPRQRQSLFFSATMPNKIIKLSNSILNYPEKVSVHQTSATADTVDQLIYYTNKSDKRALLTDILKNKVLSQVLIFSRTKYGADRLVKNLKKKKIAAVAIHGDKSQPQRQRALKSFKNKEVRVLVATDIAARGIDIDKLNFVINFDIPNEPETYVHRIGRCGRAGEKGQSISICEPEENMYAKDIEKLIKVSLTEIKNHKFPQTDLPMNPQQRKEFEKQKQKKKQEFFANRKKNKRTK